MKEYGKKHHNCCHEIAKTIGIGILLAVFFALGAFLRSIAAERDMALWKSLVLAPEPESCALCGGGIPYHAPVLVDLSTGETGELRVYDPDPQCCYELAEEQSTGTFSFLAVAGLTGYRDTCDHTCRVTLPKTANSVDPALFCRSCRALLADTATEGYILADLYDVREIRAYAVKDGTKYTIRDYAVSTQEETGGLSINVTGLLFTREE